MYVTVNHTIMVVFSGIYYLFVKFMSTYEHGHGRYYSMLDFTAEMKQCVSPHDVVMTCAADLFCF